MPPHAATPNHSIARPSQSAPPHSKALYEGTLLSSYQGDISNGLQQEAVVQNLIATVAQVSSVNVQMEVGAVAEVVTVTSKGVVLDTSTSDVSTLIDPQQVQHLPLANRAPEDLVAFMPGAAYGGQSATGSADTPNTATISINGSRSLNTEVLLNGVSMVIASTGTLISFPSPDALDQLRFIGSNAAAEYGRTSGAVLTANTKSGTNKYHGNALLSLSKRGPERQHSTSIS